MGNRAVTAVGGVYSCVRVSSLAHILHTAITRVIIALELLSFTWILASSTWHYKLCMILQSMIVWQFYSSLTVLQHRQFCTQLIVPMWLKRPAMSCYWLKCAMCQWNKKPLKRLYTVVYLIALLGTVNKKLMCVCVRACVHLETKETVQQYLWKLNLQDTTVVLCQFTVFTCYKE